MSRRGWIDVTFGAINGLPVSADSILDSGAEFTLSSGSQTIVVDGTPVFLSRDDARRRSRTATSSPATRGGTLTRLVRRRQLDGQRRRRRHRRAARDAAASRESTDDSVIASRLYLDVTLTPTTGATVDASTVAGTLHLTGAGAENLTRRDGVTQIGATTFRYLFRGSLGTGKVTASFAAGAWPTAPATATRRRRSSSR